MEEVGINAKEHLLFARQRDNYFDSEIISGSMRTVEGLKMTVKAGTVPTIGPRVWDKLIDPEFNLEEFMRTVWNTPDPYTSKASLNVLIDEKNHKLSKDFFKQMNDLGSKVYKDWRQ